MTVSKAISQLEKDLKICMKRGWIPEYTDEKLHGIAKSIIYSEKRYMRKGARKK